jgi:hypothetical protein
LYKCFYKTLQDRKHASVAGLEAMDKDDVVLEREECEVRHRDMHKYWPRVVMFSIVVEFWAVLFSI